MLDELQIRQLIHQAAPNSGQIEPSLRRSETSIRAAEKKLRKIANSDPDGFLALALEKRLCMGHLDSIFARILADRHYDMLVERLQQRVLPDLHQEINLLGLLRDPRAVDRIVDHLLVDEAERLEYVYARVLQKLDRARSFERLVALLHDESLAWDVRLRVGKVLARFDPREEVIPQLRAIVDPAAPAEVFSALAALLTALDANLPADMLHARLELHPDEFDQLIQPWLATRDPRAFERLYQKFLEFDALDDAHLKPWEKTDWARKVEDAALRHFLHLAPVEPICYLLEHYGERLMHLSGLPWVAQLMGHPATIPYLEPLVDDKFEGERVRTALAVLTAERHPTPDTWSERVKNFYHAAQYVASTVDYAPLFRALAFIQGEGALDALLMIYDELPRLSESHNDPAMALHSGLLALFNAVVQTGEAVDFVIERLQDADEGNLMRSALSLQKGCAYLTAVRDLAARTADEKVQRRYAMIIQGLEKVCDE